MLHNLEMLKSELREGPSRCKLDLEKGVAAGTSLVIGIRQGTWDLVAEGSWTVKCSV